MEKISCIYMIRNKINNKVYIGQTSNYNNRKADHIKQLSEGKHENPLINKDLQVYTVNDFEFKILEMVTDNNDVRLLKETMHLNKFGGIESDNTYNCKDNKHYNKFSVNNISKGTKGKKAHNKGQKHPDARTNKLNTKYKDPELIQALCNDYKKLGSYDAVAQKYHIGKGTVHRLITNHNKSLKNVSTNQ